MTDISDTVEESLGKRLWRGYCRYAMAPKLMLVSAAPVYAQSGAVESGGSSAAVIGGVVGGLLSYYLFIHPRQNK